MSASKVYGALLLPLFNNKIQCLNDELNNNNKRIKWGNFQKNCGAVSVWSITR